MSNKVLEETHRSWMEQQRGDLQRLCERAEAQTASRKEQCLVVCIDVDDPFWAPLADILMPGSGPHWEDMRAKGLHPCARGVVVSNGLIDMLEDAPGMVVAGLPGPLPRDRIVVVTMCSGSYKAWSRGEVEATSGQEIPRA